MTSLSAVIVGILLALWLGVAAWALVSGLRLRRQAGEAGSRNARLEALFASAPAVIMIVHGDGTLDVSGRVRDWLGLPDQPRTIDDLVQGTDGLEDEDRAALDRDIRAAQTAAAPFSRVVRPRNSSRAINIRGGPAPVGVAEAGAATIYLFDATEVRTEMARLTEEAERHAKAFDALSGLIEASPIPMWHRGPDLRLTLVNSAYVSAVEAESAADVIARGVELVEAAPGRNPLAAAAAAREQGVLTSNVLPATIGGERRSLRVVDVPLGQAGVAGYAIDESRWPNLHACVASALQHPAFVALNVFEQLSLKTPLPEQREALRAAGAPISPVTYGADQPRRGILSL